MKLKKQTILHDGIHFSDGDFFSSGFYQSYTLSSYIIKNNSIGYSMNTRNKKFYI